MTAVIFAFNQIATTRSVTNTIANNKEGCFGIILIKNIEQLGRLVFPGAIVKCQCDNLFSTRVDAVPSERGVNRLFDNLVVDGNA